MSDVERAWENRMAALWDTFDDHAPDDFVAQVERLAAELPLQNSVGLFERASAHDSTGRPDVAVPLYRDALNAGLGGRRRREATIQLASSLRNLGQPGEAANLLSDELRASSDDLDGAVCAFLALALVDLGQPHRAVQVSAAIQSVARALCERAHHAS